MRILTGDKVAEVLRKGSSARVDEDIDPKFTIGETVLARNTNPLGHTRIPRYVRGRLGTINKDHGVFIFPDTHALGEGKKPKHVYSVCFTAQELWGSEASPQDKVYVDLWDDYLESI